eukprot:859959-Amphidinium_carterae.1
MHRSRNSPPEASDAHSHCTALSLTKLGSELRLGSDFPLCGISQNHRKHCPHCGTADAKPIGLDQILGWTLRRAASRRKGVMSQRGNK